jgi:hypothetical protein
LKRYEFLKFWSYFLEFSEARDLFGIIFQISEPNYKIMDCGLILKKQRGQMKNVQNNGISDLFLN